MPKDPFEYYETVPVKQVPNNYHVQYNGFYYSVPYMYYHKPVTIHGYGRKVEIFDEMGNRIAVHQRRFTGRRYVTEEAHMPENHKAVFEFNNKDGAYYRHRAAQIGQDTYRFVDAMLEEADFEEQAYKSCMGIINFSRQYNPERVNRACKKALEELHSVNYTTVKNILKNGQDKQPAVQSSSDADNPTPYHENLRVGEWS